MGCLLCRQLEPKRRIFWANRTDLSLSLTMTRMKVGVTVEGLVFEFGAEIGLELWAEFFVAQAEI